MRTPTLGDVVTATHPPYTPARLFFLGAGFSRPAGLPLANELLSLTLRELERFQRENHVHWAPALEAINIEDFIAYLDHEHFFGLLGSDTFSSEGNRPQLLLRWGIGCLLHRRTPDPLPDVYLRFAEGLRAGDVAATFNYDLIAERALPELPESLRGGVPDARDRVSGNRPDRGPAPEAPRLDRLGQPRPLRGWP